MSNLQGYVRRGAKSVVAILLVGLVYALAQLPQISNTERARLAGMFAFERVPLPTLKDYPQKTIRNVNPSLYHFASWISTVGAAVALNDLDDDGLPNDLCYVDPRIDQVVVTPVPGTPGRYAPFSLNASPLPFDPNTMAPMGALPGDFNEDGAMDILVYYWGRTPIIFIQVQDKSVAPTALTRVRYTPYELVAGEERWYTNAATQADLDGDGHVDLIFGNYFPDGARILDANSDSPEQMQDSMSMALNGGRNRFFLWSAQPILWAGQPLPHDPSTLFREAQAPLDDDLLHGWTLAVGAADLDGDMLPEVYFANDFGPDRLLHNLSQPGELKFQLLIGESTITTPKSKVLGRDSFKGMGVDFADLNGDGFLDIHVSNIAKEYALEESHQLFMSTGAMGLMKEGVAPYHDLSEPLGLSRSGWGWDVRFGDFNNDSVLESIQATGFLRGDVNRWPELHELAMGNDQLLHSPGSWPRFRPGDDLSGHEHNPFFVRARDNRYYDVAAAMGLAQTEVSRGVATADVDGDGRLDFAVANQWDTSYFYRNTSPHSGAFLGLRLVVPILKEEGEQVSVGQAAIGHRVRPAIGASATVHLPDGRRLVAQVDGGNGHSGKRSPELHFGLGAEPPDTPLKVDLRWRGPNGQLFLRTLYLTPGRHTVQLGW